MAIITGTAGNDRLTGTAGDDTISGLAGNDFILAGGTGGTDVIDGGAGIDSIDFRARATGAVVVDFAAGTITGGGAGTIRFTNVECVIAGGFDDLLTGDASSQVLRGEAGADTLWGAGGADFLWGGSGADTFAFRELGVANADAISDFVSGSDKLLLDASVMAALGADGNFAAGDARFAASGTGTAQDASDRIVFNTSTGQLSYDPDGNGPVAAQLIARLLNGATLVATDIIVEGGTSGSQTINGSAANDVLAGGTGNDTINGFAGNDSLEGREGNDILDGGAGSDTFVFAVAPGAANADAIAGFVSGVDRIQLDGRVHANSGPSGTFAPGDGRFAANSTGTAQDATDRVVYNTTNGQLWYDPDGTALGAAQLVATLDGAPTLAAGDIVVVNGTSARTINGTAGNDTLTGTVDADTINGFAGNDVLIGGGGSDRIDGGPGDDVLNIFASGGTSPSVVLIDESGVDAVIATSWTLGAGFENLVLRGGAGAGGTGVGNELDNLIRIESGLSHLFQAHGGGGNDMLTGGTGSELLFGDAGDDWLEPGGTQDRDEMTGGSGQDRFVFRITPLDSRFADTVHDFGSGVDKLLLYGNAFSAIGAIGDFAAGDARFLAAAGATSGRDASDRIIYNTSTGDLYYDADGSGAGQAIRFAVLTGAPAASATDFTVIGAVAGTAANDTLTGTTANDILNGFNGNDTLAGLAGLDTLTGGAGNDNFVFRTAPGSANADRITDFAGTADQLLFENAVFTALGVAGTWAAGDTRLLVAAGATSGADASDRLVYDTSTGNLYYDVDGAGGAAAQIVATLAGTPALSAADITVI